MAAVCITSVGFNYYDAVQLCQLNTILAAQGNVHVRAGSVDC